MGLLRWIFRSINVQSVSDDPAHQDPASGGNQLSLTFLFGHSKLGLYIGPSGRPDDAEPSPTAVKTPQAPPGDAANALDQPLPSQAADSEQQSRANDYCAPQQRQDPTTVSFWDALDPTEREALRAVAFLRTFAAGATIMHEGERADHVIVILGGRARICVNENGRQRVLVERGVGQLVGERAALQISVRSATVTAVEMVWALVAQTKDFAAFVTAHPRVLALVQEQSYDRGTDYGYGHDDPAGFHPGPDDGMATRQHRGFTAVHPHPLNGENCTVILTDVVAFGARTRTDRDRLIIRKALSRMTRAAMPGLPGVWPEDRGDGMLMVIPPDVPTAVVMDQLLQELPGALDRHNGSHDEQARFQLRLAINVGPVVSDTEGVSGEAIIVAARLVDAPDFKEALVGSTANLGVIASPFVYETVIRHGRDPGYSQVPVEVKESRTIAWMKFFDAPPETINTTLAPSSESIQLSA